MKKTWRIWKHEDCPDCGSSLEVETSAEESYCYDGDAVRCTVCTFVGGMTVGEEGLAYVQ